jgi:hypothetical protein
MTASAPSTHSTNSTVNQTSGSSSPSARPARLFLAILLRCLAAISV